MLSRTNSAQMCCRGMKSSSPCEEVTTSIRVLQGTKGIAPLLIVSWLFPVGADQFDAIVRANAIRPLIEDTLKSSVRVTGCLGTSIVWAHEYAPATTLTSRS